MKRFVLSGALVFLMGGSLSAFSFFMEGGLGYNTDENVGLGFIASSKGAYFGIGTGMVLDPSAFFYEVEAWKISLGVNIDFLIKPKISFVRGEEHYQVQNIADGASLRILPYLEISRGFNDWFYAGFGLGYGFNNIYFGMRPQLYDKEYTHYKLSNNSWTPTLFLRSYIQGTCYLSLNYEVDIVVNGELTRLAGDPLASMATVDGAKNIQGVHHRGRLVFGWVLPF
ncbi:MAG: hypothetical protein LBK27_01530 [Treponema sp.]|jgi:hypothetical protein|nr:hypothetical protein [Treponema sp.]